MYEIYNNNNHNENDNNNYGQFYDTELEQFTDHYYIHNNENMIDIYMHYDDELHCGVDYTNNLNRNTDDLFYNIVLFIIFLYCIHIIIYKIMY